MGILGKSKILENRNLLIHCLSELITSEAHMDDLKLINFASKAAGIEYTHNSNPLNNDALALLLAVKLGFSIDFQYGGEGRMTLVSTWTGLMFSEYHSNSNPAEATRRAIVRAAAGIGSGPCK